MPNVSVCIPQALYKLLITAGEDLDKRFPQALDPVIKDIEQLVRNKSIPNRNRFLLEDVLALRKNGWQQKKPGATIPATEPAVQQPVQQPVQQQAAPQFKGRGQSVGKFVI